jgi:MFS family permease
VPFSGKVLIHLLKCPLAMWRLGFFFHEMAFGLLSVFIPLYVVTFQDTSVLGGPLVALGIMTSLALFLSIPASFFWGYICDKTRRYKLYILFSFLSSTIILFLFTLPFAQNIIIFIILYVAMSMLHVAHEAPKNVLIAEHYSREEWEKSYAFYEGLTEIGFFLGLVFGLFAFASTLSFSVVATYTLYLCSGLSLVAFVSSIFLVADPLMIFERRLVGIEKKIDFTYRGSETSSKLLDGLAVSERFREENFLAFGLGLVLFSLASSTFFTPLPIFFSQHLSLPTSMIFVVYMLNSGGAMIGYFFIGRRAGFMNARKQMRRMVLLRSFLVFLLVAVVQATFSTTLLAGVILVMLGFAYALYYILMLSLSMELIPVGKNGVFDVLVGLGAAIGSFLGPFLAETFGFLPQFLIASAIFLLAFAVLKIFS